MLGRYVMPAEFVAMDAASRTVTFRTTVPASVFDAVKGFSPGVAIKVSSPYWAPADRDTILTVERHTPSAGSTSN
jgi:hypothetical protein